MDESNINCPEEEQGAGQTTDSESSPRSESEHSTELEESIATTSKGSRPLRVSVQRQNISSARVQECDEELQGLGVDVYDQQTYEDGVFEQVDQAITREDDTNRNRDNTSNQTKIDDLIRLIHDDQVEQRNSSSFQDKDEEVLRLTQQERLSRAVKLEPIEVSSDDCDVLTISLPKIHRKSKYSTHSSHLANNNVQQPSTSGITFARIKTEVVVEEEEDEEEKEKEKDIILSDVEDLADNKFKPDLNDIDTSSEEYEPDPDPSSDGDKSISDCDERSGKHEKIKDDGDFKYYSARIKAYSKSLAKKRLNNILDDGTEFQKLDETITIEGDLQVCKDVWDNLFEHQKTGVRWLWELHQLGTGGILGDEMGLGKTIQTIAFLIALKISDIVDPYRRFDNLGPTVLVCPATVMHQWLSEFRKWYPPFRVAILHSTGTFCGDREQLIRVVHKSKGILICSYPGVVIYQDFLHAYDWHYAILDEGHKIRNPDAQVTLACKRFRTPHRIILSGSPVQNNLRELWSIFDFIYPGKLGTLPVFMAQFAIPITQGGYANANDVQVQIAYKCACILRDTIKPFLLRRTKAEVNCKLKLPDRSEQVLFCKMTDKQRNLYKHYLESPTVRDIKHGRCQIFVGLIQLRKICNHPDLFDTSECVDRKKMTMANQRHPEFITEEEIFGHHKKSGKMMVVDALLKLWNKQKHKVLLFTQSRQMLRIFSEYLKNREYNFLTMDGSTPIGARHSLIEEFNSKEDVFLFLLTTRVGGVGINLIGANRIIIYDPDWNPSTDIQARERAWRIGQKRHVIIYRLLTAGTIEEKIYHRQVFKLYLTNRILKDAKQKRFFKTNDLHELFTLGDDKKNIETNALFDDDLQINKDSLKKSKKRSKKDKLAHKKKKSNTDIESETVLSSEKIRELREKAKKISQMIATQYGTNSHASSHLVKCEPSTSTKGLNGEYSLSGELHASNHQDPSESFFSPIEAIPYRPSKPLPSKKKTQKTCSGRQRLDYLVKQDIYKPNGVDEPEPSTAYKSDDYILGRLFKNSNIFSALKHDQIETDSTSDFKVVESEAEKVARDAIRALRESRRMCLGSTSGVPNWTGRNGQLASSRLMPKNRSRAAQQLLNKSAKTSNSESILSIIKKRNHNNPVELGVSSQSASLDFDEDEANADFVGRAKDTGAESMADRIRNYLMFQAATNGEAQTDEVLEFFKSNFPPDKTAVFKALLYKMCEFERRGNKGFWRLRSEFRSI